MACSSAQYVFYCAVYFMFFFSLNILCLRLVALHFVALYSVFVSSSCVVTCVVTQALAGEGDAQTSGYDVRQQSGCRSCPRDAPGAPAQRQDV